MALTRRTFVACVTLGALAVFFCPLPLRPFRDIVAVICLAWLANYAFDLWENARWARAIINFLSPNGSSNKSPDSQSGWDLQRVVSIVTQWLDESNTLVKHYGTEVCRYVRIIVLNVHLIVREGFVGRHTGLCLCLNHLSSSIPGANYSVDSEAERNYDTNPACPEYYAMLVTTPPIHVYGAISDRLSNSHITPEPLPWDSYSTSFIPTLLPSLVFRTHVAFCLVRKSDWESRRLTLFEKLQNQRFWDLQGENSGDVGALWSKDQIAKIDRIENLGIVDLGKDAVDVCMQRE